jgi:hypothetical protein
MNHSPYYRYVFFSYEAFDKRSKDPEDVKNI